MQKKMAGMAKVKVGWNASREDLVNFALDIINIVKNIDKHPIYKIYKVDFGQNDLDFPEEKLSIVIQAYSSKEEETSPADKKN